MFKRVIFLLIGIWFSLSIEAHDPHLAQILIKDRTGRQTIDLVKVCQLHKGDPHNQKAVYNLIEKYRGLKKLSLLTLPSQLNSLQSNIKSSQHNFDEYIKKIGKIKYLMEKRSCRNESAKAKTCQYLKAIKDNQNKILEIEKNIANKNHELSLLQKDIMLKTGLSQKTVNDIPLARGEVQTILKFPCERTDVRKLGIIDISQPNAVNLAKLYEQDQIDRKTSIEGSGVLTALSLFCADPTSVKGRININRIKVELGLNDQQIQHLTQQCSSKVSVSLYRFKPEKGDTIEVLKSKKKNLENHMLKLKNEVDHTRQKNKEKAQKSADPKLENNFKSSQEILNDLNKLIKEQPKNYWSSHRQKKENSKGLDLNKPVSQPPLIPPLKPFEIKAEDALDVLQKKKMKLQASLAHWELQHSHNKRNVNHPQDKHDKAQHLIDAGKQQLQVIEKAIQDKQSMGMRHSSQVGSNLKPMKPPRPRLMVSAKKG